MNTGFYIDSKKIYMTTTTDIQLPNNRVAIKNHPGFQQRRER
ncbi:hypothetical protein BMETH_797_0 [methanotrophic bacterial endosymbiont of Bathymodiolus sp.]|nr:hypothetical protein BMETH_797_0 [methanotrophic bacterial endosymbiont of Bathymodiolus sp.]